MAYFLFALFSRWVLVYLVFLLKWVASIEEHNALLAPAFELLLNIYFIW